METHKAFFSRLKSDIFQKNDLAVWVYRLDEKHPLALGNKFYKLKYNLQAAKQGGYDTLLSFGGAYSNHLYALAGVAKSENMRSIGIVRGERVEPLNPILRFCEAQGMQLHFVSREAYRQKAQAEFIQSLAKQFGRFYLLPEGGSNALSLQGTAEIPLEIPFQYDYLLTPCGTAGTLAGLLLNMPQNASAVGVSVLKGGDFLHQSIQNLWQLYWQHLQKQGAPALPNYDLRLEYHFGGYAKKDRHLEAFIKEFEAQQGIPIEPVYSGKMFYALYDLARQNYFQKGSNIIALHTGGVYAS